MKRCSHCNKPLTFADVLTSINPLRIKCRRCQQTMQPSITVIVAMFLLSSVLCVAAVVALRQSPLFMLIAVIAIAFVAEFIYFKIIAR